MLRQDHGGGVHFHHDRRTLDLVASLELGAVVDDRGDVLAFHEGLLLGDGCGFRILATRGERLVLDLDALTLHRGTQRDHLVLERQREREEALVLGVELRRDRIETVLLQIFEIQIHGETQALAAVTDVDLVGGANVFLRNAFFFDALRRIGGEVLEDLLEFLGRGQRELTHEGACAFIAHRRRRVAERAEHARTRRNDRGPGAEQARQRVGVDGPAPPKAINA